MCIRDRSIGGIPVVYDGSLADGILVCEDDEAFKMMRELSFKEGILGGISTGATFKAALDYCLLYTSIYTYQYYFLKTIFY